IVRCFLVTLRYYVRPLAVAIACLVIGQRGPSALQQFIRGAAWEFRKSASSFGEWDIWHPPTGQVGASFQLQTSASPPDGRILNVGMSLRLLKFGGGSVDDYAICRSF
ncbi:MAG TPA: hypothetical protein VIK50_12815, partial [Gemmatimonadaceae bacterium]